MTQQTIRIGGARQHNLQNLSLTLPRGQLVVFTGPSGSGKSSLAFDTLYAEGRRRYVESLSAYARQFLDQLEKPDVDFIEGLSPAIALEQRAGAGNPRSTIATTTEIYDYLRLLYASVGQPHDPATGRPLRRQTPQAIVDEILALEPNSRLILLAPVVKGQTGEFRDVLEKVKREGFVRVRLDGKIVELDGGTEPVRLAKTKEHSIEAVVDRLVLREGIRARLSDSVETALRWGKSQLIVLHQPAGTADPDALGGNGLFHRLPRPADRLHAARADRQAFLLQQPPGRVPGLPRPGRAPGARPRADGARPDENAPRRRGQPLAPWRRQADARLLPSGPARTGGAFRRADGPALRRTAGSVPARALLRHGQRSLWNRASSRARPSRRSRARGSRSRRRSRSRVWWRSSSTCRTSPRAN